MTWALFLTIRWEFLHLDFLDQENGWLWVMSKKLKLEHLPMRRNPDRKSKKKKKKAWKYLQQQQVPGIIVLLFVLVTDSRNDVKKITNLSGSAQEKFIRCYTTHQCRHSCSVDSFPWNNSGIQPLLSCTLAPFQPRSSVYSWQRKSGRNCPLAASQLILEFTHISCTYSPFIQIFFLPSLLSFFLSSFVFFIFQPHHTACRILVPQSGIEPRSMGRESTKS